MYSVEFNYNEFIRKVQCDYDETLRSICKRYCKKTILDINTLHFLYLNKEINFELNFSQVASDFDKARKIMTVSVLDRNLGDLNLFQSTEIVCPSCYSSALLDIEKYQIKIHDCRNGHNVGSFLFDEIEESQLIDFTQIKCEKCKIYSRAYTYQNEFYRCNTCKINLCPICEMKHDKNHQIINYDRRNYVCDDHKRSYHSFCKNCKKNMCVLCEKEHSKHKIVYLAKMFKHDKKELTGKLKKIRAIVDTFANDVKMIINKLNLIKENMKSFYELNYKIIHNYNERNVNYEVLKNIDEIMSKTEIFDNLESINKEKDIYSKFKLVYDLYGEMIYKNEINMVYKKNKLNRNLKIFGEDFVKENKSKCKMVVEGKEQDLKSEISVKDMINDKIRVRLTNINKITDMSFIFHDCSSLYSVNDMSKWKTTKIKDMHKIFYGCSQLTSLPDLSFWSTSSVRDICGLFYNCLSLTSIPDISEWDVSKIVNLSGLFCGCERIKSLPDISQWDTSNVTDMNSIFCGCSSLERIPNIERWSTDKVKDMSGLFCGCSSIIKLPNIAGWNISKVKDLSGMFFSCSKVLNIPDISGWNTENVKNMTAMFGNCSSLTSLPDINKWKLNKNIEIINMFVGCPEILEIPEKFRSHIDDKSEEKKEKEKPKENNDQNEIEE